MKFVTSTTFRFACALLPVAALAADPGSSAATATFTKDVAPILYQNCTGCHHPNDIAPMSLMTYKDARPWAASVRQAVTQRVMPPWYADPHYGQFANDPRLSDAQIATIDTWVKQGAKEGDPADLPKAPVYSEDWKMGKPDMIVDIGEDYQVKKRDVPDEYTYFVVDPHFTKDTWVKSVELRPGNRKVVHHAHVWVDVEDHSGGGKMYSLLCKDQYGLEHMKPDAPVINNGCLTEDGGDLPGRKVNDGNGPLGSYLPGKGPDTYPEGTAKLIPAGAKLKFQVHYNNALKTPQTDRTEVGFIFADHAPEHPLHRIDSSAYLFLIPPGDADHEVSNCTTFQKNVLLMSYVAHMHFRGKDMKFELVHTDGRRETLVNVPHYSFAWQQIYRLKDPVPAEKGSRLIVTAHFDNSANNKWNPDPKATVRWGEPSSAEMMDGWVEYIDAKPPSGELSASSK